MTRKHKVPPQPPAPSPQPPAQKPSAMANTFTEAMGGNPEITSRFKVRQHGDTVFLLARPSRIGVIARLRTLAGRIVNHITN